MKSLISWKEAVGIVVIILIANLVSLWAMNRFRTQVGLYGHRGSIVGIEFVDRNGLVATACSDSRLRLFSSSNGSLLKEVTGHSDRLTSMSSCIGSDEIATSSADGTIKIWKVPDGIQKQSIQVHDGIVIASQYSGDGRRLVSIGDDRAIRVWNPIDGKSLRVIKSRVDLTALAVNPTGKIAATNDSNGHVVIWNLQSGKTERSLRGGEQAIKALAFSHDGLRLAVGEGSGMIRIFNVEDGKIEHRIVSHDRCVNTIKFSEDDGQLISGSSDGRVGVWDFALGYETRRLEGHPRAVLCVAVSSTHGIASGSYAKSAILWKD